MEGVYFGFVTHKDPAQLGGGHLVGQVRSHKGAGVHAYVDIHIVEVEAVQRFIQGSQGTDLINTAQRPAPAKGEADPGCRLEFG